MKTLLEEFLDEHYLLTFEGDCYSIYLKEKNLPNSTYSSILHDKDLIRMSNQQTNKIFGIIQRLNQLEKNEFIRRLIAELKEPKFRFKDDREFWAKFEVVYKDYRIFILSLENKNVAEQPDINQTEPIVIDNHILQIRTKLLLFEELGLLAVLRKLEQFQTNTELSKILAEIFETNEDKKQKTFDSLRTDLSYLDRPKENKYPKNATAIKKLNVILAKYGLKTIAE